MITIFSDEHIGCMVRSIKQQGLPPSVPRVCCAGQRWVDPGPRPAKWEGPKQGSGRPALGANINACNGAEESAEPSNPNPAAALCDSLSGFRTASAVLSTELARRGAPGGGPRETHRAQGPGFSRAGRSTGMDEDETAGAEMFPGGAGAFSGAAAPRQVRRIRSFLSLWFPSTFCVLMHAHRTAHVLDISNTACGLNATSVLHILLTSSHACAWEAVDSMRACLPQGMQRGGRGGVTGGSVRGGFVPPFVRKALDANNARNAGRNEPEGPLPAKTLEMLAGPDGELPEVGMSLHTGCPYSASVAECLTRPQCASQASASECQLETAHDSDRWLRSIQQTGAVAQVAPEEHMCDVLGAGQVGATDPGPAEHGDCAQRQPGMAQARTVAGGWCRSCSHGDCAHATPDTPV